MKKLIAISLVVVIAVFIIVGPASAWVRHYPRHHYHGHVGFRVIIPPPVIWGPPVYYGGYYYSPYPHYGYYDRGYDYDDRVWVPGYWGKRWTPYGWQKVWVPGYWR